MWGFEGKGDIRNTNSGREKKSRGVIFSQIMKKEKVLVPAERNLRSKPIQPLMLVESEKDRKSDVLRRISPLRLRNRNMRSI